MGSDDGSSDVLVERRDRVLLITINRPAKRNSVNGAVASAISSALEELEADRDLWAGVLTGAGGYFCAGADIRAGAAGEPIVNRYGWGGIARFERTKPLLAAVEGFAFGGGCEMALASDLITAGRSATFALPEVRRSFIATAGGLWRLPERVPRNIAMEM